MADRNIGAEIPVLDGERLARNCTVPLLMVSTALVPVTWTVEAAPAVSLSALPASVPVVADPAESYESCLSRMREAHVRHVIVLDQGRLAGIVSLRDLLAVDIDEKDEAIGILNAYVST